MKKVLAFAVAIIVTLSTAVFAQNKMQDAPKTRKEKKAAMKADKMQDKMSDGKMMKDDKMSDGKMKDDKMKPKNN